MNLSRILLLAFVLLIGADLSAQEDNDLFAIWPDSALAKANTAAGIDYMTEQEQQVVFYINLCRMNPALFSETFVKDYLKENHIKKDKEVKELMDELAGTSPRMLLEPSEKLCEVARAHAKDMGMTGRTGHNASNGTSYRDRMGALAQHFQGVNENTQYGYDQAIDIVMDLLIDRDVPNAGHRKNILDSNMRFLGVAIEPHKRYQYNCVQDFGGSKI